MTENGVEGDYPVEREVVVLKGDDGNAIDYSATKLNSVLVKEGRGGMSRQHKKMSRQEKIKRSSRRPPKEESDDYPFAEGLDGDIDLDVYAEALSEKRKNPEYDPLKDTALVKSMIGL